MLTGLPTPFPTRRASCLGALSGDCGMSTRFKVPVTEILMPRRANTAILGLGVLLVMVPLALVLGVLAGMKEGSPQDRAISVFSIATTSDRKSTRLNSSH